MPFVAKLQSLCNRGALGASLVACGHTEFSFGSSTVVHAKGGQVTDLVMTLVVFFARVEALCVQVLHKSPWSSEEGVTIQVAIKRRNKTPKNHKKKHNQTPKSRSNLLRNSCGHGGRMKRGETGAMNSTKLSVVLVPQQLCYCFVAACVDQGRPGDFVQVTGSILRPPSVGRGTDK